MSTLVDDPIIFLHGRGLGPGSAESVARAFPGKTLLAPQGGVALRRGHTWFVNKRIGIPDPDSVAAAEARFLLWCRESPLAERPAYLCGFSNGGAFAGHLLLRHGRRFRGAALLCAPLVLPPWADGALRGKPVFYAHGDAADTVVAAEFYAAAETYLAGPSGCTADLRRYDTGHSVSPAMVDGLASWFATISRAPETQA